MTLIDFDIQLFFGLGLEVEYADGDWVDFDNNYLLVDFLCFRFMFTFAK